MVESPIVFVPTYDTIEENYYNQYKDDWMSSHNMTESDFSSDPDLSDYIRHKAISSADDWVDEEEKREEIQRQLDEANAEE